MSKILTATFETRREAEMTVERLVQEFDLDRRAIVITTEGDANSAGEAPDGADKAGSADDAPALEGALVVSVTVNDDAAAGRVRAAFSEFDADDVAADTAR
ncbi:hypothetical protein [Sphingomonas hylomeconis]|uniref:Uncharacterized protein n=1 Tax=Sphingomonas hylomeconis TaxID=1395958 RepID=A0ABV7SSU1_9SPHN|nr:hypothetical protein [Sphingomonas hylomeconis]